MTSTSPIIVENIEQARDALRQADGDVVLQSVPGALQYAGSMYLLNIFRLAQAEYPDVKASFILDCGDAWAEAITAMQDGHQNIISSAMPEVRAKLKAVALAKNINFIENN